MVRTGRPRGFDRDEAVQEAMLLFWEHGFEGTSLDRLRRAMGGISSASFYAAFSSKQSLYREALQRYLSSHGQVMAALRDPALSPRRRIEQALRGSAAMQTEAGHPGGCMVALSATIGSGEDAEARALTEAERASNRQAIAACVREAVESGELDADIDVTGLSTLLEGLLIGLSIQARDGVPATAIDAAVTAALSAWDSHRRPGIQPSPKRKRGG
ncbi:TetR/AcrR family transcriptional regulator [Acetobacteraceae bacterium KSS8]|uniref:TetR/AcrR family transcriptional regulator n=1 Tax=Endosaccharibacter trunci TaxID=2812733 RepID=A0ABT1W6S5_9PROT|nr:TetR/AcrR family transcriptional regulator [Acetobacteraceae bacterium KSS8]